MPAIQKRLAQVGLALQSALGSAATGPDFVLGLTGGRVVSVDVTEDDLDTTWSSRGLEGADRTQVVPGAQFDGVLMPRSVGLLLAAACGSTVTSGAVAPYTHTYKSGDVLPYVTIFGRQGNERTIVSDAKLTEFSFTWERTAALKFSATFTGCGLTLKATWTSDTTADERVMGGVFKALGGQFTVLGQAARVTGGTVTITNNVSPIITTETTPEDVMEGNASATVSLTVMPLDFSLYREVLTGDPIGTTPMDKPKFGAVSLKFGVDASTDLTFAADNVKFLTEFPEADPAGGPVELTLEGSCVVPASGDLYTFTLRNAVDTYPNA